jgi:hypothetical protein
MGVCVCFEICLCLMELVLQIPWDLMYFRNQGFFYFVYLTFIGGCALDRSLSGNDAIVITKIIAQYLFGFLALTTLFELLG